jgi:predicted RNA-binding protein YlqC (UPF0109 family)
MTPLVPNILTKEEQAEYKRLGGGPLTTKEQYTGVMEHYWLSFLGLLLMIVCAFGVWYSTRNLEVQADGNDTDFFLFLAGMVVAMVISIVAIPQGIKTQTAELQRVYLESIGYKSRVEIASIYITDHAGDRMRERGVTMDMIRTVISAPHQVTHDKVEGSYRLDRTDGNRTTKVWTTQWPVPVGDKVVVKSTAVQYRLNMTVPANRIGKLIGKGGENIRRIEGWGYGGYNPKNVHVDVDRSTGAVVVTADSTARLEAARLEIQKSVR